MNGGPQKGRDVAKEHGTQWGDTWRPIYHGVPRGRKKGPIIQGTEPRGGKVSARESMATYERVHAPQQSLESRGGASCEREENKELLGEGRGAQENTPPPADV